MIRMTAELPIAMGIQGLSEADNVKRNLLRNSPETLLLESSRVSACSVFLEAPLLLFSIIASVLAVLLLPCASTRPWVPRDGAVLTLTTGLG